MANYAFFTESTIDCYPELIEEIGCTVIPMRFNMKDREYKNYPDNREMSAHEFYERLREGELCTTSQLSAADIFDILEPSVKEGREVFYLAFSSGLSGTCQSAMLAADDLREKYPDCVIEVVDSLQASMGEGLIAYYVGKKLQSGENVRQVAQWVRENALSFAAWFTVDDLLYLKRGGRLSGGMAIAGTILGIKPVLHVDNEGHLINMEKVRGRKASLNALVEKYESTAVDKENNIVFVSHGDSEADAIYVAEQCKKLGAPAVRIGTIGPVIGAHSGYKTIALFFLTDNQR